MSNSALILLAEDRDDDVLLIKRSFARANIPNPMLLVTNGEEAILYLKGEGKFADRSGYPLPALLLLDLKMPIVDGFEVLRWARQQSSLALLKILVLTSSESLRDVNEAYRLGANSFLVKPLDFENCVQLGRLIRDCWLKTDNPPVALRADPQPVSCEEQEWARRFYRH